MWHYLFGILMFLTAVFLILLILVQRGRGGGLAGAFGGMGGQSAFGTKAGDLFTRITMAAAAFWILLCIAAIAVLNSEVSVFGTPTGRAGSVFDSRSADKKGTESQEKKSSESSSESSAAGASQAGDQPVGGSGLPTQTNADDAKDK